jgi:hypothetical protein
MTYPFGDLPANLAAFCGVLRHTRGFRLGPRELQDAGRALDVIDLSVERRVRDALRIVLCRTVDDARAFDGAFDAFFFPRRLRPAPGSHPGRPRPARQTRTQDGLAREPRRANGPELAEAMEHGEVWRLNPSAILDEPRVGAVREASVAFARYSPARGEGRTAAQVGPATEAWRNAARVLVARVRMGLSRRWRPGRRGRRFDLRRTWRASLRTGGETLDQRWLQRTRRAPRFVVLVDGSRSMGPSAVSALEMAVALASATRRIEVFTFSTALARITPDIRQAALGRRPVRFGGDAWGGGTRIGGSLRALLHQHGERCATRDSIVLIASDGLDVGEPEVLRDALERLRRRTAALVWLNPLLDSAGYEPSAAGMRTARPFVTTLASVSSAEDLVRLAGRIRFRP